MRVSNRAFLARVAGLTPETAERGLHQGTVSQDDYDRWSRLWTWSACRFSGIAGARQEAFYRCRGSEALEARRARVRRAIGAVDKNAIVCPGVAETIHYSTADFIKMQQGE